MTASLPGPGADRREAMRQSIRALLGPAGAAAALFPGYEARPGQLAMADRIADAIDGDERLLVEAGTGTGKTLAYLVPALLSGRKVVVSTGTKTLQDQIAGVDLPRLRAMFDHAGLLPAPLEWAVMKGLSNYVCRRRLGERDRQRSLVAEPELDRILAFAASSPTGDRADLRELADDAPLWGEIAATPETRIGPRCAFFESCFVTAMRRRAAAAPLIVVNHHLFFADLALKSRWPEAQVLPPYEVGDLRRGPPDRGRRDRVLRRARVDAAAVRAGARSRARDRRRRAARAGARRAASRPPPTRSRTRCATWRPPRAPASRRRAWRSRELATGPALERYHDLDACLEQIADWLNPDGDAVARSHRPLELAGLARRATALRADLSLLVAGRGREHVRWLAASPRNVGLHASPVDVSPVLGRALDACPGPIVFTSATLTVAGSFDYLRTRVGLGDTAADATFPSPVPLRPPGAALPAARSPRSDAGRVPGPAPPRAWRSCARSPAGARCCCSPASATCASPRPTCARCCRFRCWCRASAPATCCSRRCASGSARCCWRRRASGRASTSPARRCRWSSWTRSRSRSPTIR